ncbi:MAG TPA: peptide chain release factor N(5)-glutamine methyltransferase [Candidatus Eremiobacteraceae bacterium]
MKNAAGSRTAMPSRKIMGRVHPTAADKPLTIAGAVEACRRRLATVSEAPWLEARLLTGHVTGLDASAVVAYGDNLMDHSRAQRLADLTSRRMAGEPIAYLVGFKEFRGLRIAVDKHVLVPRQETEELVEAVVEDWRGRSVDILDMGTGSGAIACALANALPRAQLWAVDASDAALAVARANVEAHLFLDRITVLQGDLFEPVPPSLTFDAIVANLPYVASDDPDLAAEVREHEPALALFGGADGLDVYRRMLVAAPRYLRSTGSLYCECGPHNAYELAALARTAFTNGRVEVREDLSDRARLVVVALAKPERE